MQSSRLFGFRDHPWWNALGFIFLVSVFAKGDDPEIFVPNHRPRLVLEEHAGEGPAWHPRTGLLFTKSTRVSQFVAPDQVKLYRTTAAANGLLFDRQGRLLICEPGKKRVIRENLDGSIKVLTDHYRGLKYNTPNDLSLDSKNRIYFSDPRYGNRDDMQIKDSDGRWVEGVYRIDPDGTIERIITHEADRPNGVLVSSDDRYLFVADNNNKVIGGARKLWRFGLTQEGRIETRSRHLIFDWKNGRGPDGLVSDKEGRIYVAAGVTVDNSFETSVPYKGGVYVFSPKGEFLVFAAVPRDEVTNCTFGGDDLKTLYITAGGTLWSVRTLTAGWLPAFN
jgi:gluconolactonase